MPTSDRQRVELMLPAVFMLDLVLNGFETDRPAGLEELLRDAMLEPVADLVEPKRSAIIRRSQRVYDEVVKPFNDEEALVWKFGLVAFYWLQAILDQDFLVLYADSAMQRGLDIVLPYLEVAAGHEKIDTSAQKRSRKFLQQLQRLGYYRGVIIG